MISLISRWRPAHPRSRGENDLAALFTGFVNGSSPLTRGKHRQMLLVFPARGLIPAHAGKTHATLPVSSMVTAHPRSRGENTDGDYEQFKAWGSSPLTRGKLRFGSRRLCVSRLIPLTRGKLAPSAWTGPPWGLIPAHAGKTLHHRDQDRTAQAHPRSRGENVTMTAPCVLSTGSSPLTRGKHPRGVPPVIGDGLIPAHAGKTFQPRLHHRGRQAHPRSRGENYRSLPVSSRRAGSSPLTRGKRRQVPVAVLHRRLIPAHAGKTADARL